jgi:predicted enzyme related to lactoylglutathione lyase
VPAELNTVLYPVKDLDKAKATFSALFGAEPHVDSKYYVGYEVDGHEVGLIPNGHDQGMTGACGAVVLQEPTDVANGLLVAKVRDTEGNVIGVKQLPADA